MAVPVSWNDGTVFAGINVIVKSGVVPVEQMAPRFLSRLQAAASELERVLNA
jgi:DNA-binding IclR family transcriptional regulator